jgi:hypothetical protein
MEKIIKCNSIDCTCNKESEPIRITDAMGREVFWLDAGRPE